MDYIGFSMTLTFDTCETRHCVIVSIVNDMVDEPDEVFDYIIGLQPAGLDPRITIRPDMGEIFIIDDDSYSISYINSTNTSVMGSLVLKTKVSHQR